MRPASASECVAKNEPVHRYMNLKINFDWADTIPVVYLHSIKWLLMVLSTHAPRAKHCINSALGAEQGTA